MATNVLNSLPAVVTVTQQALLASNVMSCMYLHAPPVLSALECTGNDELLSEGISGVWAYTVHQITPLLTRSGEATHPERLSISWVMPDSMAVFET